MAELKLKDIKVKDLDKYQSIALSRLTLLTLAKTHTLLGGFQDYLLGLVNKRVDEDGNADITHIIQSLPTVEEKYNKVFDDYTKLLTAARYQAGALPFATLVAQHNHFMGGKLEEAEMTAADIGTITKLWFIRRKDALAAAQTRVEQLTVSQSIWKIKSGGLNKIKGALSNAYVSRTSAIKLAKELESHLGADASMPRWAVGRLYGLTATERAQTSRGLLSGSENQSKGIAYNAIRLARTELQYANHAVSTAIVAHAPWVIGRKVTLSPAHPKSDICDKWAAGGPYDKGQAILPLHPNCLCYYTDVLSSGTEFYKGVTGWLNNENEYLDDYSEWMGTKQVDYKLPWALNLADSLELWLNVNKGAQAAALNIGEPEAVTMEPVAVPYPVQKVATPVAVPVLAPPPPAVIKVVPAVEAEPPLELNTRMEVRSFNRSNDAAIAWANGLSDDEHTALKKYQGSYYRDINGGLRGNEKIMPSTQRYIEGIDQAMERSSLPQAARVFRGMKSESMVSNFDNLVGAIISDKGFVSTSLLEGVSTGFAKDEPSESILLKMVLPKGTKAIFLDALDDIGEAEILLPRGSSFRVTKLTEIAVSGIDEVTHLKTLEVEYIPPK